MMPKETFWDPNRATSDGDIADLTVTWHGDNPGVFINGAELDRSGTNRLIRTLRRARDATFGSDE